MDARDLSRYIPSQEYDRHINLRDKNNEIILESMWRASTQRFEKIESDIKEIRGDIKEIGSDVRQLKTGLTVLATRVDGLEQSMTTQFASVNTRIDDFQQSVNQRFDDINQRFDDMRHSQNIYFAVLAAIPVIIGIIQYFIK